MTVSDLLAALNPATLGLAFLAACGAYLLAASLGLFGRVRLPRFGRHVSIGEAVAAQAGEGADGDITLLEGQPLLERAFGPLVRSLVAVLPHKDDAWVAQSLDLLAYPGALKTIQDFYALQVIYALIGFGAGITLGLADLANSGDALGLFFWSAIFSLAGYALPRLQLRAKLAARRDAMLFEAPYVFDQLAVSILANSGLIGGMKALVNQAEDAAARAERRAARSARASAKQSGAADNGPSKRERDPLAELSSGGTRQRTARTARDRAAQCAAWRDVDPGGQLPDARAPAGQRPLLAAAGYRRVSGADGQPQCRCAADRTLLSAHRQRLTARAGYV